MKKAIIIMGDLASGKSTYAKKLAHDLNIMCFCKDDIKEILFDELGSRNREENLQLSHTTFLLLSHSLGHLPDNGILLLESNFKYYELDLLRSEHHDTIFLTIFLTAEVEVLYRRYIQRQDSRHIAHKSVGELSFQQFQQSMMEYLPEKMLGKSYQLNTSSNENVYNDIKKIIDEFITIGVL